MCHNKILGCHNFVNKTVAVSLETKVAVGNDTYKPVLGVNYRNTTDMIFSHEVESIVNGLAHLNGDRVIDHTVLCSFYDSHLASLILNTHILVDNTDASFAGNGNCHRGFCHSIHSGSDKRYLQFDVTGELCTKRHITR